MTATPHRRGFFLAAAAFAGAVARAGAADDWTPRFREFVKQLNRFIETSNDGILDAKQWKRVEAAWEKLEKP